MGKTTQTVQETKGPANFAVPYVNDLVTEAQNLYRSGAGTGVWKGPNVAALDPLLSEGIGATVARARADMAPLRADMAPRADMARRNAQPFGGGVGLAQSMPTPSGARTPFAVEMRASMPTPSPSPDRALDDSNGGVVAPDREGLSGFWNEKPSGPPTGGSPQPGIGDSGAAGLPYDYALRALGSDGLTPQMRQPLDTLGNVSRGADAIGTGGLYGGLLSRSLDQNRGANGIMGVIAGGQPVSTAGAYGGVAARTRNANRDVIGTAGAIADGTDGISVNPRLAGLFDASQEQNVPSRSVLGRVANGADAIGTGAQYRAVADSAALPTVSSEYLTDLARGGGVNPYLQQMLDDQAARVSNRINSSFSGAGRYGSVGHADALAQSIASANNPLLSQAYESDQNRRLSAASQIDASRRAAEATRLNAIAGETGVEGQNIGNRLAAAQNLAAMRNADTALGANLLGQAGGFENQNIANRLAASGLMGNLRNANVGNELAALGGMTGAQGQDATLRLNAASGLANSNRADVSNALGAAGGLTGVQGQNIANRMGAANNALEALGAGANRAVNWAGLAPALNNLAYDPASRLMGVGNLLQGRSQAELDAQKALFEQANAMPWTELARYAGLINPTVQPYSTGSKTTDQSIPWTEVVKLFGGNSSPMQGLGSALGTIGSAAGNILPILSDRDAKTDVKKVGRDAGTDLDIYAYRYKGDPKSYPKVVGPMAQDVARKFPGATGRVGNKLYLKAAAPSGQGDVAPEPLAAGDTEVGSVRAGQGPVPTARENDRRGTAPDSDRDRAASAVAQLSELVRSGAPMPQGVRNAFAAWSKYARLAATSPKSPRAAAMLKITARNLANNLQSAGVDVSAADLVGAARG